MATYKGKPTCSCGAKWLPVFERKLAEYGITVRFTQLIGNAKASAGIHGAGLCFDLVVEKTGNRTKAAAYSQVVKTARQMGADATWHRPYNWDNRKGMEHIHGLGNGCTHLNAGAKNQQAAVKKNRNGLANNGVDTGPRPLSGRTWKQGIEWAEKSMALSDGDIKKIVNALKKDLFKADVVPIEAPIGTKESRAKNPEWQVRNAIGTTLREVVRTRDMVSDIVKRLEKLEGGSGKA